MNYKPKTYAKSLVNSLTEGKIDDKKMITNFLALLERNGDMKKANQILVQAEALLLKKTGNKKVVLEIARKNDAQALFKEFIKKGDVIEEKINPRLVAGVRIIVNGNKQLDFSLSRKLENIF